MTEPNEKVIIDTDPGIDDAQAILFALKCGLFEVEAITTTFGNCDIQRSLRNAQHLTELASRTDISVFRGAAGPLFRRRLPKNAGALVHGKTGFGDVYVERPRRTIQPGYAAAEMARRVVEQPGTITVLALAPLTNIALAMRLDPRFTAAVRRIIYMGGIISGPGNVTPVATANVYNDVEAAKIVFEAGIPEKLVMVGQDVTRKTRISDERRERMRHFDSAVAQFLYDATGFYREAYLRLEPDLPGFPVHDLLVMMYALRPDLFDTRALRVDIATSGITAGMTVGDLRPSSKASPNATVCLDAAGEEALSIYEEVIRQA